jgi:hypothetical protein
MNEALGSTINVASQAILFVILPTVLMVRNCMAGTYSFAVNDMVHAEMTAKIDKMVVLKSPEDGMTIIRESFQDTCGGFLEYSLFVLDVFNWPSKSDFVERKRKKLLGYLEERGL